MSIVAKPYQAFPMHIPGVVDCGCSGVDWCVNIGTSDLISFQVGLTACPVVSSDDEDRGLIDNGSMVPIAFGVNTASGATLTDGSQNFATLGTQEGITCGYIVKNVTSDTYTHVITEAVSTLTLAAAIFGAPNQSYELYPWNGGTDGSWKFNGASVFNDVDTTPNRQCNRGLVDNMYYVAEYEVLDNTAGVTAGDVQVGGQAIILTPLQLRAYTVGVHKVAFNPQVWTDDHFEIETAGAVVLDNLSLYLYSTIGIKIFACTDLVTPLLDDSTNTNGWITYFSGHAEGDTDIRAQVDIPWTEVEAIISEGEGCFQICLYDLCDPSSPGTEPCVLESYSINVAAVPTCKLNIKWTNHEDFEIENGDYLDYPVYPGYPGYTNFTQCLRTNGKLRYLGFQSDSHVINKQTDGLREITHSEGFEAFELQIERLPEDVHQALHMGLRHDVFIVNGDNYISLDGEYSPNWTKSSDYASVVVRITPEFSKGENVGA